MDFLALKSGNVINNYADETDLANNFVCKPFVDINRGVLEFFDGKEIS